MALLECAEVVKSFGSLRALDSLTLEARDREILGVVGPNGSGKTTLFNVITKVLTPNGGLIRFADKRIDKLSPDEICHLGIARTFQIPAFFPTMSVWEQTSIAASFGPADGQATAAGTRGALELAGLSERAEAPTPLLNLYEKKRLMIATALAARPKLLLLDEPLAGLTASEVAETLKLVGKLRESGMTIMLVEHNMRGVFQVADRLVVMHRGQKLAEGTPADVAKNPQVVSVYLGEGYL